MLNKVDENGIWRYRMGDASRDEVKQYYISNYVHAHVERSLKVMANHFLQVMEDQQVFALNSNREFKNPKCIDLMLKIMALRNDKLKERVK